MGMLFFQKYDGTVYRLIEVFQLFYLINEEEIFATSSFFPVVWEL